MKKFPKNFLKKFHKSLDKLKKVWYNKIKIKQKFKKERLKMVVKMTEMTRREFFNAVAEGHITDEHKLFAEKEIAKMDERNAKRKTQPSKKSIENEPIKEKIVDFIGGCETSQIASVIAENVEISTQKASALCKQLVEVGTLNAEEVKVKGKGKVKAYSLA